LERRLLLQAMLAWGITPAMGVETAGGLQSLLIRINIPGPHLVAFIPIELIPILGIDEALGAHLVIHHMPSGVQALQRMEAGDAHFAGVGFSVLPRFASRGKPVVAVASLGSGMPPYAVLVRNDLAERIRTVADLRGLSIGIPLGSDISKSYPQTLLELWLASVGVQKNQVRWVPANMNFDGMYGALASGAVDAVFCEEALTGALLRKGYGARLASLADSGDAVQIAGRRHLRAVIASTPKNIGANPRRAELMVLMVQRALAWIHQTPPETVVARLNIANAERAADLIAVMQRLPDLFTSAGGFSEAEIRQTVEFLEATGKPLGPGMDVRSLIDTRWSNKGS
jgi:NitT/TauT family transport system substrate-binding protein